MSISGNKKDAIGIVGAGIGGLAAALAFLQAGRRVRVFEQAPALGEIGAGLTLSPNGTRVLRHLGVADALQRLATEPAAHYVQHYRSGEVLRQVLRGRRMEERYGAPYWQIHRADLHGALAAAIKILDPRCIELGRRLREFREDDGTVILEFDDGSEATCAAMLGCDGTRSLVRSRLLADQDASFAGFVSWRGLVSTDLLSSADLQFPDGVFVGPGRMLAHYRLRGGRLMNFAASLRRADWNDDQRLQPAMEELRHEYGDFHPTARAILAAVVPERCYGRGLFSREPLQQWSVGRITLLGDAAHPTLPFLGQGANLALEDAVVLARAVATTDDIVTAFQRYEAVRCGRCARVMRASIAAVGAYLGKPSEDRSRGDFVNEDHTGLFDYDALTVPV